METKIPKAKVEKIRRRLKFHSCFTVEPRGLSGGLCLLWNSQVQVKIFQNSPNFIHTAVFITSTREEFDCSFVYGNPTFQMRKGLWSSLLDFQSDRNRPWCCLGDFNEVLAHYEKSGIRPYHPRRAELFRDFLNIFGLMDMELKGCAYTWISNPRNGVVVQEKLDRVLVNWPWRYEHPNAFVTALPIVSFDHSPIVLNLKPKEKSGVEFKF